jgi:hypothetical protein
MASAPQVQNVTNVTQRVPDNLQPYLTDVAQQAQAIGKAQDIPYGYTQVTEENKALYPGVEVGKTVQAVRDPSTPYRPVQYNAQGYEVDDQGIPVIGQRITGFNANQLQTQGDVLGLKTPGAFNSAYGALGASGLAALNATNYGPASFSADQVYNNNVGAAQTGYNPQLTQYQMDAPEQFGQEQFNQYASPYMQNVVDVQKQAAIQDAQKAQLAQNLGAARQGTYGGARQLLATTERERALGQQLGGIQASGLQSAYENAQAQFERDRASGMTAGQANLQALLGTQQLGTQTGLQSALANLTSSQQANLANSQQGLQAMLANQQQNLEAQRMGEASRQFGANLGLQGSQQLGQLGQTYTNLGSTQMNTDLARLQAQQNVGAQQQGQIQGGLDQRYNDWLDQQNAPRENLSFYNNIISGLPMPTSSTTTQYGPKPSAAAPYLGLATAGLGIYNTAKT